MLERLETIDSETDNMDVTIVKMGDPRYARKWGVTNLPSVVYFRNRFPSIYRGKSDLLSLKGKTLEQNNMTLLKKLRLLPVLSFKRITL